MVSPWRFATAKARRRSRTTAFHPPDLVVAWALSALLPLVLASCGERAAEAVSSALLITLDTTNPGALGCYGGAAELTPNLDRLAAEGMLFERARTVAPITAPAHASILTGLVPLRHSVRMNASMVLPEEALTLAERARAAGFRTAAFVAAVVLDREFGFDQGFELYDEPAGDPGEPDSPSSRRGDRVADGAVGWLRGLDPAEPFFLWVHFYDAHYPYDPPPSLRRRAGGDAYLGEVAFDDRQVERILETLRSLGRDRSTTIVVVADHGEGLGRHGEETHGTCVYDSTLAVPLIVRRADRARAGKRFAEPVSVVDVFPTLVQALGLGSPGDVDGSSLLDGHPDPARGVYFESYFGHIAFGWSPLCGWADALGKYVHCSEPEFYGPDDPAEERNLYGAKDVRVDPYRGALRTLAARTRLVQGGLGGSDATLVERIEKLGYAGAGSEAFRLPEPLAESHRPSPHRRVEIHRSFTRAAALIGEGRPATAVPLLLTVVRGDPGNFTAWNALGKARQRLGRLRGAIEAFRRAIETRGEEWVEPLANLGICAEELGRDEEAIAAYRRALRSGGELEEVRARLEALQATGEGGGKSAGG